MKHYISCIIVLVSLAVSSRGASGDKEFSDMVLCYGGSHHRHAYAWDEDRFDAYVTYTDENGREHWLFDAFLCLEFADLDPASGITYSLMINQVSGPSGSRGNWQNLIDYWFAEDNGFHALDASVGRAIERLGKPFHKRYVVMSIPDPCPYLLMKDTTSTSVYWGELDGRELDFLKNEDRVAAYEWYIDSVRSRFEEADFRNIELLGFYIISECLPLPSHPWYNQGRLYETIPHVAEYVHSGGERLYWIPYSQAPGWETGKEMGFDFVWMQPNHFWRGETRPMDEYAKVRREGGVGMEFEFDAKVYESNPEHEEYRNRFRRYMECAKAEGVYGTQPITYYIDSNCVYALKNSESGSDRDFYHEFCSFVINNPLRDE